MKQLSSLLAIAAMLIGTGCSDSKDVEKPAELVDLKPSLKVERLWSYGFGGDAERLRLGLRATTADGVAYAAGYNGEIVALALETGRKLWSVKTKLDLSAGPGVGGTGDGAVVIVGASDGIVLALDAKTGKERWRHQVSSEVLAPPVVVDDVVIIRTVDGRVVALSADNAASRWSFEQSVPRLSLRGNASPVVAGDSVIAAFDNGRVVSVELKTGDTQWDTAISTPTGRSELDRMVDIDAPVRVVGDDVFVVSFQGRVAMLARDSGQIWWARDFSSYRGLAVEGNSLFATNAEGVVIAMRRTDGSVTWEQSAMRLRALTGPTLDGTSLVVGDYEGYLHWLSSIDGALLARASTDGERITNAPVVADGRVLVQTDGGKLIAFKTTAKGS
ncbi:MAG: outer membrane protein assembly factor BamB [Candidatus Obscuribacterales bacterium]|nr:outer membrane protein assembly factor BamB [Steroidobacteraceae bacterium]